MSVRVDPSTGDMYIIDSGRTNFFEEDTSLHTAECPPKLVIYNVDNDTEVMRHVFPQDVVSQTESFLNDLAPDPQNKFVYISNTEGAVSPGIVVFNMDTDTSHQVTDKSMQPGNETTITINGMDYPFVVGVNGIALSPDREHLFYSPLGGLNLYTVPTADIQQPDSDDDPQFRQVGTKESQADGILMGHKRLYYGALSLNAFYAWEYAEDMTDQSADLDTVTLATETEIAQDNDTLIWVNSMAIDSDGWAYIAVIKFPLFHAGQLTFDDPSVVNFRVTRYFVDDCSYLVTTCSDPEDPEDPENTDSASTLDKHFFYVTVISIIINRLFMS